MKKALLISILAIATYCVDVNAQTLPDVAQIKLENKSDYNDAADTAAKQSANYLLSVPLVKNDLKRLTGLQFLMKWMEGTPKYQFSIDESAKAFLDDPDHLGIYLAALVKTKMEQPNISDNKVIGLAAVKLTLAYMGDTKNQVKRNKKIKALMDADKKGTLEQEVFKTK